MCVTFTWEIQTTSWTGPSESPQTGSKIAISQKIFLNRHIIEDNIAGESRQIRALHSRDSVKVNVAINKIEQLHFA